MTAVRDYLRRMREIRGTGGATSETSYYSALENLLNELGGELRPKVVCNGQLRSQGAGHPDFGLYTATQCRSGAPREGEGEVPERGVVEVKPLSDDTWLTAQGEQATRYFDRYRLVLVTNYRDFRLIGEDRAGNPVQREFFSLADDEAGFWTLAANPSRLGEERITHFAEFLQRVMMNAAPLRRAEDVAWFLASYARDAMATLDGRDASALEPLKEALEAALGITFEGEKGEHFFLSTLVQTLFYGIFSAWVLWARGGGGQQFDWRSAGYSLTVPMIRTLFEEIARPSRLQPLNIIEILDRTGEALNRIDRTAFFASFDTDQAVQHFYEPFLEAFDPQLRKDMGVWYTPPEIVRYMVERVDRVLRTELGVADGLADPNVYVLDPCCGTGAYLIEVLRRIEATLRAKGDDALIGDDIKQAARERVFGFEIMSAPFVIAHWRIGDLLARLNAPLDPSENERPAVYLTNALTGWQASENDVETRLPFPELEAERDQAEQVKQEVPILVVIGNPPYNAYAGTSPEEEEGLVEPYKSGLRERWGIKKYNLDELYIRFLRVAERRIAATSRGLVCYISSYSYLTDPSFVVTRERLLSEFDEIWIDSLNGDSRETGKKTPEGLPDPSVFSTPLNRAGIKVGTAVGLFLRGESHSGTNNAEVRFRDFWGTNKRDQLLESLEQQPFDASYQVANPEPWNRLSFKPLQVSPQFLSWPTLEELAALEPLNGLMEKRGGALIDIDRELLVERMTRYFDSTIDWETYKLASSALSTDAARFNARTTRANALSRSRFDGEQVVRYLVRPFDLRHAYYTDVRPIWNEPRPELWAQYSAVNRFLMSRPSGVANPEGVPVHYTAALGDNDAQRGHSYYFPFEAVTRAQGMLAESKAANLSSAARDYLSALNFGDPDSDDQSRDAIWLHALAISHSPEYLSDNADGISVDWPRIPLPADEDRLRSSSDLGEQLASLLDPQSVIQGVTSGTVGEHLRLLGVISSTDLRVTAGWGSRDRQGRVNPGQGSTDRRAWTDDELGAIQEGVEALGLTLGRALELLGPPVDVYLNDDTCWRAVPQAVWDYVIGGYQVIKKWLSYREASVLGRPLSRDEAREVTAIVRRLATLVLMNDTLDANYRACRDEAWNWPS